MSETISTELRAVLALRKYGFQTKHALGQNFITDEGFLSHLLDLCDLDPEDNVLEIGPGPGIMSSLIADRCRSLAAIEADARLENVLREVLGDRSNAHIVIDDALKADIASLTGAYFDGGRYRVIANLPYYITADLILKMLAARPLPESICVMVQKEAADRIMSRPGDKDWCALAAEVAYYADCRVLEEVPPERFDPQPHVMSCFIRLDVRRERLVDEARERDMIRLIRCCFHMRRKTLANNLKAVYGMSQERALSALEAAGLNSRVRGEALNLEQIADLLNVLTKDLQNGA